MENVLASRTNFGVEFGDLVPENNTSTMSSYMQPKNESRGYYSAKMLNPGTKMCKTARTSVDESKRQRHN